MTMATTTNIEALRARFGGELGAMIPDHLERLHWTADRLAEHQRQRLRIVLRHAIERSPFHAHRLAAIDPDRFELADLAQLPIMTKAEMMAAFDDVVTDRRLSLRQVEDHLAKSTEPCLLLDDYVCLASGGSSGLRGVFVQRLAEFAEFGASIMRSSIARQLAAPGAPQTTVIAAVMAASPVHASGFGVALMSGPTRFVSVPATLPIAETVDRLNSLQPPALMGYPTKLVQLAREQLAGRLAIAPRAVSATSEHLTAEDRATITAAFGVPVVNQFASTEGLVGHSEPGGSVLTFASDMCIVEIASPNILVTNLHNLTQPLIRYELTDRFVRFPSLEGSGYVRAEVGGRAGEVFRYGGVEVHPVAIDAVMVKTPAVAEYQVRQTDRGVDIAVVADGPIDQVALVAAIEASLREAGLVNPTATVRVVAALERHPQSGKVQRFVAHIAELACPGCDRTRTT